ncbi:MAG TPA: MqnA/MqnD/SBP family protein [Candidatus Methylacidiphilales bacterium]|jgi:1,4-dihydroxy-6-naphthoate synthase|nr:MqnA/MqnD/SBP family protein [Candidatus Methylacidiphilales bacterium]
MKLTLGHSPDPDDAFMFYALAKHLLPTPGYEFEHILQDIQTLNERATRAELDITAISIHAYAYVLKDYALLRSGASMGDNYGPMIVGKKTFTREELRAKKIAVPGLMTSAFLALQLFLGAPKEKLDYLVVPFDRIFDALARGDADAGLIIHEGQLTYAGEGLVLSADLGQWWFAETGGLPLPLGGNAVKKSLGGKAIAELSDILHASIKYGLDHRAAGVEHALPLGRGLDRALADKFIGMYVNELTLDYGERGQKSVRKFLDRAHHAGLIPAPVELEFV